MNDKIQQVISYVVSVAKDDAHGYDQEKRFGPDYDCSSLVISAWEYAGVKVKSFGASYTGNMRPAFLKAGFIEVISSINTSNGAGLVAGDVLLRTTGHTAVYIGNGAIVQAQSNEKGTKTGGKPGDQTGKEIFIRSYYNSPWNSVLRYATKEREETTLNPYREPTRTYQKNMFFTGNDAGWFQWMLENIGHNIKIDEQAGPKTWEALNYEISQAGLTGDAGKEVRDYLKGLEAKKDNGPDNRPTDINEVLKELDKLKNENALLSEKIKKVLEVLKN